MQYYSFWRGSTDALPENVMRLCRSCARIERQLVLNSHVRSHRPSNLTFTEATATRILASTTTSTKLYSRILGCGARWVLVRWNWSWAPPTQLLPKIAPCWPRCKLRMFISATALLGRPTWMYRWRVPTALSRNTIGAKFSGILTR